MAVPFVGSHPGRASADAAPAYPVLFCKFASNLIAGDADIELPPESGQVD